MASPAEVVVRATFDQEAGNGVANYFPGSPGDKVSTVSKFQCQWGDSIGATGGWLTNQFSAPDIVTPPTAGPEGGNALTCDSNAPATSRKGYWVQLASPVSNQDFTIEFMFSLKNLNPANAEYKIQNLFTLMWPQDDKALELRFLGSEGGLGTSQNRLEMMTNTGGTAPQEHNITSGADAVTTNTWYHAAVVYKHATKTAELFLNGTSIGTANVAWDSFSFQMFCLAAWPNPAGSCRDISGYIDAFALSNAALDSSNFDLTHFVRGAAAHDWQLFR